MILIVDIGNSNTTYGLYENDKLVNTFTIKSELNKTADEYYLIIKTFLEGYEIEDIMISSVVPILTSLLKKTFSKYYHISPKITGTGLKTGIKVKVDEPKTVGADLICDCLGATKYASSAIIVDLGTANKFILMKDRTFLGVAISPGFSISMKALSNSAALLPNIELIKPNKVIGTNTITAMQSGIINGAKAQIDGMINMILEEEKLDSNFVVVATGGLSSLIIPLCENKIILDPNLTLDGLYMIYQKNKENLWL